jgi:hypothetical protein
MAQPLSARFAPKTSPPPSTSTLSEKGAAAAAAAHLNSPASTISCAAGGRVGVRAGGVMWGAGAGLRARAP